MLRNISILLADDHPMLLKGLHQEFVDNGYTNVSIVSNGAEALNFIAENNPKIAILDIEMPLLSGFEVIQKARELQIATKFIILTYHKEKGFIVQAKKMQIEGYLIKDDQFNEIENCIKQLLDGKDYVSSSFNDDVIEEINKQFLALQFLTPSERTIIRLIAQKLNSNEIANQLNIAARTVQKHRTNIIAKLELDSSQNSLSDWTEKHRELILTL